MSLSGVYPLFNQILGYLNIADLASMFLLNHQFNQFLQVYQSLLLCREVSSG